MKFSVYAMATISKYLGEYEAASAEEASEEASDDLPGRLCHHCAGNIGDQGDWEVIAEPSSQPRNRAQKGGPK